MKAAAWNPRLLLFTERRFHVTIYRCGSFKCTAQASKITRIIISLHQRKYTASIGIVQIQLYLLLRSLFCPANFTFASLHSTPLSEVYLYLPYQLSFPLFLSLRLVAPRVVIFLTLRYRFRYSILVSLYWNSL